MKYLIILLFFCSTSYGQSYEIIDPVTQQSVVVYSDAMKLPKVSAREAIKDCNKRIEENPQDWQAYHIRARSKQNLSDFKATIEDTDVLIENEQLLNFAYWIQGETYIYLHDYKNAMEAYKNALDHYSTAYAKAKINYMIGMCYIRLNNEEEACVYFDKMRDLRSRSEFEQAKKYCLK
jgi:tetratricopeptide (TPR) repeat protein